MKRRVILDSYGPADNLRYETLKTSTQSMPLLPEIKSKTNTHVVIEIKACAVSHLDVHVRRGLYSFFTSPDSNHNSTSPDVAAAANSEKGLILGYEIAGVVLSVGTEVMNLKIGDHVAALLPLDHHLVFKQQHMNLSQLEEDENDNIDDMNEDSEQESDYINKSGGGYSDYVTIDAHFVVKIPDEMLFEKAAACILSGIRAYSFLFDHCRNLQRGSSILVQNGANVMQNFVLQLALSLKFNVWTTANSDEEINMLTDLNPKDLSCSNADQFTIESNTLRIIDLRSITDIRQHMMQETGGVGIDAILMDDSIDENTQGESTILDFYISILGLNGILVIPQCPFTALPNAIEKEKLSTNVTQERKYYMEQPIASNLNISHFKSLFLKNGRIGFLFEQSYVLSCSQQGRFLHMLSDIIAQVNSDKIVVKISHTYPLEKIREAHRRIEQKENLGKIVLKL
jgi:NADPH:quinone reductase-like Zn-dependent oxidoreductase